MEEQTEEPNNLRADGRANGRADEHADGRAKRSNWKIKKMSE